MSVRGPACVQLFAFLVVSDCNALSQTLLAKNTNIAEPPPLHSTVTLLARFRGLSTSVPRAQAV